VREALAAWRGAIGVVVGSCACIFAGLEWNLAELVGLGIGGIAIVAFSVATGTRRSSLAVRRSLAADRVVAGEATTLLVEVTNDGRWPSRPVVGVDFDGWQQREFAIPPLAGGATHRVEVAVSAGRRGIYSTGPTRIEGSDPFRLVGSARREGGTSTLVVHPRVHAVPPLSIASRLDPEGLGSDVSPNGSESFHALRDYDRGDDHRLIHWRSSARRGQLVVRQFVDVWIPEQVVVLDDRQAVHTSESFELAVEIAASVLVAAAGARWPVTLVLTDGRLARQTTSGLRPNLVLDRLAGCVPGGTRSLDRAITEVRRMPTARAVVLVTGSTPADQLVGFHTGLGRLRRRTIVRAAPDAAIAGARGERELELIDVSSPGDFVERWRRLR
jgi:uncharacterized protein (DUF58 family)